MAFQRSLSSCLVASVLTITPSALADLSPKKGVGLNPFTGDTQALSNIGASWFYDWGTTANGIVAPAGVSYVPMIWGANTVTTANLGTVKAEGNVLLGFNEPDGTGPGQANMSAQAALALWPQLVATGMRLGSPAVAANAQQAGGWLDQFMSGAASMGLRVDFICLHWYGGNFDTTAAVTGLQSYIKQTHDKYNLPIWVTEYALTKYGPTTTYPTDAQQEAFASASVAMLEATPYVERYAWFILNPCNGCAAGDNKSLTVSGGNLSPVGVAYSETPDGGSVFEDAGTSAKGGADAGADATAGSTSGASSGASSSGATGSGTSSGASGSGTSGALDNVDGSIGEDDGGSGSSKSSSGGGCQCQAGDRGAEGAGWGTCGVVMVALTAFLRRRRP